MATGTDQVRHGRLYQAFESFFDGMQNVYRRTLHACLQHRPWVMLAFAGILVATGFLFVKVPKGVSASDDTGHCSFPEAAQDVASTRLARSSSRLRKL